MILFKFSFVSKTSMHVLCSMYLFQSFFPLINRVLLTTTPSIRWLDRRMSYKHATLAHCLSATHVYNRWRCNIRY